MLNEMYKLADFTDEKGMLFNNDCIKITNDMLTRGGKGV